MKISFVATALSPISHIGDSVGINAEFRRQRILHAEKPIEVPVITGNSFRGILRDCAARYMLNLLGVENLPLPTFYLLFSGGALSKQVSTAIKLESARNVRRVVPMLSLFGGASGNHIMAGRLKVGTLYPIARETVHLIPPTITAQTMHSVYDLVHNEAFTRSDDAKNVHYERYFATSDDVAAPQQMRYEVETLIAGTQLYGWIYIDGDESSLEYWALLSALHEFSRVPALGGKSATGHGLVKMEFDLGWSIQPDAANLPDLTPYNDYLLNNQDRIRELLYGKS